MDSIFLACKERIKGFPEVSQTTLWRSLRKIGFAYKKRAGRGCVHEHPDIVVKHHRIFREMKQVRQQGQPVVYLDEMWVNQHHSRQQARHNAATTVQLEDVPSGKGKHLILFFM